MIKVGVIGHTGRLGKPLMELLTTHPKAEVVLTESRKEGQTGTYHDANLIFIALPAGESEQYLAKCEGKRVIDLSEDHRYVQGWTYGLPEMNRREMRGAVRVANPGCYATSILLGLLPLKGCIEQIAIAATSGISGAGKVPIEEDNFLVYKEGNVHSHLKEITRSLSTGETSPGEILFVPQRVDNTDRGIVSTIFCKYAGLRPVSEVYGEFYAGNPFVNLVDKIETRDVNKTNRCNIKVQQFGTDRLVILSTLDNIIRGGSGQAIQNFNLMYGFDETTGLI